MYYLFYGEDDLTRSEQIKKLREKMGDPQFADLNTTQFDGRKVTLGELLHACNAVPFLTDKRLVIVEGLLARLNPRTKSATKSKGEEDETETVEEEEANPELAKGLVEYLPHLPETTRLIFVEAKTLAKNNPVLKQATADAEAKKAVVKEFTAPKDPTRWILDRVKHKGGTIADDAANELAAHIGSDLRLLDNEIEKLITFRANELIRTEDVRALVASVHESNIFALVDAIGNRQTKTALDLLHAQLNHNAAPGYLLSMITRQFRLLLQMKDLATRGLTVDGAVEKLKLNPFVARKTWSQATGFSIPRLEAIYRRLLDTDLAIKTSRAEPLLALDLLVVDLTR